MAQRGGLVSRILRFGSLQAALLVNPSIRLAELAEVYGYSDQAHLPREFKTFAHCNPRDFAAAAPPILGFGKIQLCAIP